MCLFTIWNKECEYKCFYFNNSQCIKTLLLHTHHMYTNSPVQHGVDIVLA